MPLVDFANTAKIQEMTEFDVVVRSKIGNKRTDAEVDRDFKGVFPVDSSQLLFDDIIDDPTEPFPPDGDIHGDMMHDADELANLTGNALDEYLNAEVMMPLGGDFHTGTVKRRKRDADGELIGTRNSNSILDSCSYEVEFTNGATEEPHCQKHVLASW